MWAGKILLQLKYNLTQSQAHFFMGWQLKN